MNTENYVQSAQISRNDWINPSSNDKEKILNEERTRVGGEYNALNQKLASVEEKIEKVENDLGLIINKITEMQNQINELSLKKDQVKEEPRFDLFSGAFEESNNSEDEFIDEPLLDEPILDDSNIDTDVIKEEPISITSLDSLLNSTTEEPKIEPTINTINEVPKTNDVTSLSDFMNMAKQNTEPNLSVEPITNNIDISKDVSDVNDISNLYPINIEAKMQGKGARFIPIMDNSKLAINE